MHCGVSDCRDITCYGTALIWAALVLWPSVGGKWGGTTVVTSVHHFAPTLSRLCKRLVTAMPQTSVSPAVVYSKTLVRAILPLYTTIQFLYHNVTMTYAPTGPATNTEKQGRSIAMQFTTHFDNTTSLRSTAEMRLLVGCAQHHFFSAAADSFGVMAMSARPSRISAGRSPPRA